MRGELVPLGRTGLSVSPITLGGSPLGSMPEAFGYTVSEAQAVEVVTRVLASDIRTIDTSNGYSDGDSERRIGRAIAEFGGLPADVVVITKTDARQGDYSGERVRRGLAESAERLGISPLPLVHLHDPEFHSFDDLTAPGGAVEALVAARDEGLVTHIGLAGGDVRLLEPYLDLDVFEVLLVHNRWTLLDRSAGALLDKAAAKGMGLINAAVLGGGILADMTGSSTSYGYRPASEATLYAAAAMRDVCRRYGTDIATAAVGFSVRDGRFATTVVGMSKPERIEQTIAAATTSFPDDFWAELESLLPGEAEWLDFGPLAE